jgi:hypothetical protein
MASTIIAFVSVIDHLLLRSVKGLNNLHASANLNRWGLSRNILNLSK